MATPHIWHERFARVHENLLEIFGRRFRSLVAYQSHFGLETGMSEQASAGAADDHAHALVIVETLSYTDLVGVAARVGDWAKAGVGTPLFLTHEEFERSLDAFPLEFSAIAAHHMVVAGPDPFAEVRIDPADIRRACETQAKSHLLHLREAFLEGHGEAAAVGRMIAESVPALRALLLNLARLDGVHARSREALARHASSTFGVPEELFTQLLGIRRPADLDRSDALRLYTAYLDAMERLARLVDGRHQ
jgi:hypothetical protein